MKESKPTARRMRMPPISEEMKRWSAMLGEELKQWPKVKSRPMFGMRGFYRESKIFAALPVTRGVKTPNSFIFRIIPMPPELLRRAEKERAVDRIELDPGREWAR